MEKFIKLPELFEFLREELNGKQSMYIQLVTETIPAMNLKNQATKEKNPYLDKIYKHNEINANINWNYTKSVNTQRVKENKTPDFKAVKNWGAKYEDSYNACIYSHNDKFYLQYKAIRENYNFIDKDTEKVIPTEKIVPFLVKPTAKKNQKLDKEIKPKRVELHNIKSITINGTKYIVW